MIQKYILPIILSCFVLSLYGQQSDIKINNPYNRDKSYIPDDDEPVDGVDANMADEKQIEAVIDQLFAAMKRGDGNGVKNVFHADAKLISTSPDQNGIPKVQYTTLEEFSTNIGRAASGAIDERVTSMEIRIDGPLATAWAGYDLYYNQEFHHCGVDAFQLHKGVSGWKIIHIADTRRTDCAPAGEVAVNKFMDNWHMAATKADAKSYFDMISENGIFLGTDPDENWDKTAFYQFAKPYFDKGQAWDFKAKERHVFFSDDKQIVWFNELLDTWMGACRGSGVLEKTISGAYSIKQYNLAILVPNAAIQDYLKLLKDKGL
jgi:hypothetical protein